VFPDSFDVGGLAAVWGLVPESAGDQERQAAWDTAGERITALLKFSLVEWDERTQRYRLHDLSRDFARSKLGTGEQEVAERRHAAYYMQVLSDADELVMEGGAKYVAGLRVFDLEETNIRAGQAWAAARAQTDAEAAQLAIHYAGAGARVLDHRLSARERIQWEDSALAAARGLRDREAESLHLNNLALAYYDLGQSRRAIELHEQRLAIVRELGNRGAEGVSLNNLGLAYKDVGEVRHAMELFEQALTIAREVGDPRSEGNALGNLGIGYKALGETRRAMEFYEQELRLARQTGDRRGESVALNNLGLAHYALGEPHRALEYFEQDLGIGRELGDRLGESYTRFNIALAQIALGEREKALAGAESVVETLTALEDPNAEAVRKQVEEWKRMPKGGEKRGRVRRK
jgi:tetratricopeptide (TPR) repeat protein